MYFIFTIFCGAIGVQYLINMCAHKIINTGINMLNSVLITLVLLRNKVSKMKMVN